MRPFQRVLIEENLRFAEQVVATYIYRHPAAAHLADDLISAAYEGLSLAAVRFDPERGVKFTSFAFHRIHGRMVDLLRMERVGGRCSTAGPALELEPAHEALLVDGRSPEETAAAREALDRIDTLKGRGRTLLVDLANGHTLRKAARAIGLSASRACRVRQQLEATINGLANLPAEAA